MSGTPRLQDQFMRGLLRMGYQRINGARDEHQRKHPFSRKYIVMQAPGADTYFFLGTGGAVRIGKTVTGSVPVSERGRRIILGRAT